MNEVHQPVQRIEQPPIQAVDLGQLAFEESFGAPSEQTETDLAFMQIAEQAAVEPLTHDQETAMGGFDPALLSMFLRATPNSEFAKNIEKLMVAEFVVRNTIAFEPVTGYDQEMEHQREESRKKKETVLA